MKTCCQCILVLQLWLTITNSVVMANLDKLCVSLAANYTSNDDENRVYTCDCHGEMEDFMAHCTHYHPTCWYRSPDLSTAQYTVDFSFSERWLNGEQTGDYEECLYHQGTCNTVCVGLTEDFEDFASVNGIKCQNVTVCNEGTEQEDSIYDCSNVLQGLVADMCSGEGVEGSPFEPWAITSALQAPSTFKPGSCPIDSLTPIGFAYDESKCVFKEIISAGTMSVNSIAIVGAMLFGFFAW